MAVLVAGITVSFEVVVDFEFKCAMQHSLRSGQAELVQSALRFLIVPFGMNLDYILHRWRVLPLWPQGPRLIGVKRKNTLPVSNPRSTTFGYNSPLGVALNVNYPTLAPEEVKGVKLTVQGEASSASLVFLTMGGDIFIPAVGPGAGDEADERNSDTVAPGCAWLDLQPTRPTTN